MSAEVAATFKNQEKSPSLQYNSHVRILELPNVSKNGIQKWDWSFFGDKEDISPEDEYIKKCPTKTPAQQRANSILEVGRLRNDTRIVLPVSDVSRDMIL